ncbi:fungal-specific transcription factor domain-containing protein [Cadophora sp. MPI-SDFR-AT-0126]|nr:fungal-specific transcription factor domain-containing protein [Leotiomycetes sp. MPI-SDFR-AT-0126]
MSDTSPESSSGSGSTVTLVVKACDMCRKKKIRCEPTGQTCVQCIKYKTLCHFTPISTKRAARKPAGHKRVEELEKRLKSMEESLKRATAKLQQSRSSREVDSALVRRESPVQILPDEVGSPSFLDQLSEGFPMDLAVNIPWDGPLPPDLDIDYSSGMDYLQSNPRVRLTQSGPLITTNFDPKSMPAWNYNPVTDLFSRKIFRPLPSKEEMVRLIHLSLRGFNGAFPLYDQEDFLRKFDDLEINLQNPAFWASLNVVLALAHRFHTAVKGEGGLEEVDAWKYFQNALVVVNQLTLLPPSLLATQALIGMAIITQGTPNPAPYAFLNSAAMKMAQQLDLHRSARYQAAQNPGLSAAEIEQRKRVFWIAHFMDKDISLRTGRPPIQDDDDLDADEPSYRTSRPGDANELNFFKLRIDLARIQGRIYKQLLSVRANKQSVAERVLAVRTLEASLHRWKASVPVEYQQDYYPTQISPIAEQMTPVLHSVILRLTYFHALNTIHRFSTPVNHWQNVMEQPMQMDPNMSHEPPAPITCIEEARKALKLLLITPQGDFACIWVVLHIFVSATTTLLTNILSNPLHPLAQSDLQLIEPLLSLLGLLSMQGKNTEVESMYESCRTLWERTRRAVWEARGSGIGYGYGNELENGNGSRNGMLGNMNISAMPSTLTPAISAGKGAEAKESLEDFIKRIESIAGGSEGAFEFEYVN